MLNGMGLIRREVLIDGMFQIFQGSCCLFPRCAGEKILERNGFKLFAQPMKLFWEFGQVFRLEIQISGFPDSLDQFCVIGRSVE